MSQLPISPDRKTAEKAFEEMTEASRLACSPAVKCPQCKGAKKITCTTTDVGPKGKRTESSFEMRCLTCDGKGMITRAAADSYQRELESWCRCGNKSEQVTYHDDDPRSKVCTKHHWTCDDCGKIVQVG